MMELNLTPLTSRPQPGDRVLDVDDARHPTQTFPAWVADVTDDPEWIELRYDNASDEIVAARWRELYTS